MLVIDIDFKPCDQAVIIHNKAPLVGSRYS